MTKKPKAKTPRSKAAKTRAPKPARKANGKSAKPAPAPAKPAEEQDEAEKVNLDEFKVEEHAPRLESKWVEVECPYCGDSMDVRVDPNEEGLSLVQDCQVCCKPVQISVDVEDGEVDVYASRS